MSIREQVHQSYEKVFQHTLLHFGNKKYTLEAETHDLIDKLLVYTFQKAQTFRQEGKDHLLEYLKERKSEFDFDESPEHYCLAIMEINYYLSKEDKITDQQLLNKICLAVEDLLFSLFWSCLEVCGYTHRKNITKKDMKMVVRNGSAFKGFQESEIQLPKETETLDDSISLIIPDAKIKLQNGKLVIDI